MSAYKCIYDILCYCELLLQNTGVNMKYMEKFIDVVKFMIDNIANFHIKIIFRVTDNLISFGEYSNI